ncbi:MAG: HDOD domain-containing protein [Thalassolituus sp.]|jgi:HD-like signal output (HDOD) protein|uniref:HDOD domain-containing protein n=2 Tax=Thalassolituus TaxID=187492 RepID=UPI0027D485CD|nr:HDOD domain-containing protein [Thalassolituus sp.]MDQ4424147.1 HDOD domain-containing protein [Thalassolituus sp.]MDQ4425024.1 HDOD domain-containing protein [Thalassolituus sp.]
MQNSALQTPSAAQWEAVLAFRDLPILKETRDALRVELKNPQVSFESLVPVAERDPALCWHLLQKAVSHNPGCREQIHGVYNCLSLLGMQELIILVKKLPVIEDHPEDASQKVYRQALYTAHMAGCLAAQWASAKGTPTSTAYWSAMLANSILWPWLLLDQSSHNWFHYLSEGDDLSTASRKVFGNSPENWKRLVRRHNLPDPVVDMFQRDKLPERKDWRRLRKQDPRDLDTGRQLIHKSQSASMLALTAANTAWHLHINPEGERSQRWLAMSSHAQGRRYPTLVSESRKVQLDEARLRKSALASGIALLTTPRPEALSYPKWTPLPEVAPAYAATTSPNDTTAKVVQAEPDVRSEAEIDKVSAPETQSPTKPARHGSAYLSKLMGQLSESPASFGDWHYLMQGVLKGIHLGIGIDHAIVMLPGKNRSSLRTVYSENPDGLTPLSSTSIPLQVAPLLRQLMKQSAAVHITPATCGRYFKGMPPELADALPQELLLMSVHAGRDPIGIVIAANSGNKAISKAQYQRFRQLCTTTSQGLASLRQLSAQKNKSADKPHKTARQTS